MSKKGPAEQGFRAIATTLWLELSDLSKAWAQRTIAFHGRTELQGNQLRLGLFTSSPNDLDGAIATLLQRIKSP